MKTVIQSSRLQPLVHLGQESALDPDLTHLNYSILLVTVVGERKRHTAPADEGDRAGPELGAGCPVLLREL